MVQIKLKVDEMHSIQFLIFRRGANLDTIQIWFDFHFLNNLL